MCVKMKPKMDVINRVPLRLHRPIVDYDVCQDEKPQTGSRLFPWVPQPHPNRSYGAPATLTASHLLCGRQECRRAGGRWRLTRLTWVGKAPPPISRGPFKRNMIKTRTPKNFRFHVNNWEGKAKWEVFVRDPCGVI